MTYTHAIASREQNSLRAFGTLMLQIIGGSLFIALCAKIKIPLPFTPVPLTGQTLAVLLLGIALGSRKGMLSAMLYLLEGTLGFPVFTSSAGLSGITGGYLLSYPFQAYIAGVARQSAKSLERSRTMLYLGLACTINMLLGTSWFAGYVGWSAAFYGGLLPFIPGEILKMLCVTSYAMRIYGKNSQ